MICTGCSGAVERVLKKLDGTPPLRPSRSYNYPLPATVGTNNPVNNPFLTGVKSYDVDLDKKTADVIIDDSLVYETLRDKIKKTGKTMTKADKIENGKEIPMPIHDPPLVSE